MNSLSNSAPSEKMDGERGWRVFFFSFLGEGVVSPSNSLLNWIVVRAAWILSSKQGTVGSWES